MASWTFDSHFPWKQFNQLTERREPGPWPTGDTGRPRSVSWVLLLVRSDGQPVYEQREQ